MAKGYEPRIHVTSESAGKGSKAMAKRNLREAIEEVSRTDGIYAAVTCGTDWTWNVAVRGGVDGATLATYGYNHALTYEQNTANAILAYHILGH